MKEPMNRKRAWNLKLHLFWLLAVGLASSGVAQTTDRGATHIRGKQAKAALVVGNADYVGAALVNPVNDARAVRDVLTKLGFAVEYLENGTKRGMEEAVDSFSASLEKGGVAVCFFAGHGLQVKNENYLQPLKAKLKSEADVRYECVSASWVLNKMGEANTGVNLLMLDACRNNPFGRGMRGRSGGGGLATMDAPVGTLIAFATAPGTLAKDGVGAKNSPFTTAWLAEVGRPQSVEALFKRVRQRVHTATAKEQTPWLVSSLIGEFAFVDPAGLAEKIPVAPKETPAMPPPPVTVEPEANLRAKLLMATSFSGKLYINGSGGYPLGGGTETRFVDMSPGEYQLKVEGPSGIWEETVMLTGGKETRVEAKVQRANPAMVKPEPPVSPPVVVRPPAPQVGAFADVSAPLLSTVRPATSLTPIASAKNGPAPLPRTEAPRPKLPTPAAALGDQTVILVCMLVDGKQASVMLPKKPVNIRTSTGKLSIPWGSLREIKFVQFEGRTEARVIYPSGYVTSGTLLDREIQLRGLDGQPNTFNYRVVQSLSNPNLGGFTRDTELLTRDMIGELVQADQSKRGFVEFSVHELKGKRFSTIIPTPLIAKASLGKESGMPENQYVIHSIYGDRFVGRIKPEDFIFNDEEKLTKSQKLQKGDELVFEIAPLDIGGGYLKFDLFDGSSIVARTDNFNIETDGVVARIGSLSKAERIREFWSFRADGGMIVQGRPVAKKLNLRMLIDSQLINIDWTQIKSITLP